MTKEKEEFFAKGGTVTHCPPYTEEDYIKDYGAKPRIPYERPPRETYVGERNDIDRGTWQGEDRWRAMHWIG